MGLRAFLALWREVLVGSRFSAGCPVLAVSIDDTDDTHDGEGEGIRETAARVFAGWQSLLTDSQRASGAEVDTAEQLGAMIVASVEGAIVLCRARRAPVSHRVIFLMGPVRRDSGRPTRPRTRAC